MPFKNIIFNSTHFSFTLVAVIEIIGNLFLILTWSFNHFHSTHLLFTLLFDPAWKYIPSLFSATLSLFHLSIQYQNLTLS